jgi:protein TonB
MFRRFAPLGGILLMHVAFFHALNNGLMFRPAPAVPKEVMATFITPERRAEPAHQPPPKAQPAPPKTVPVVKKAPPQPPLPAVNHAPSEKAIAVPASSTAPATSAPAAPSAPATPSAPAAPSTPAQPKTISSGVEYLQAPRPEYPAASRRMGEEGKAILRVLVNDKGRAERIEIQKSSGSPRLDEAARQAVQRALFKPYMEDGKPVAVFAVIPISFQLD